MAIESFLVNPYRSRRRRRTLRNAPRKKTARRARRRGRAKLHMGRRHRPVLYGSGSVWSRSPWSRSHRAKIKINPRRRRRSARRRSYRRNPIGSSLMIAGLNPRRRRRSSSRRFRRNPLRVAGFDFFRNMPMIAAGAASVIATAAIPDYFGLTGRGPMYKYGSQIGVVAGGGFLIQKFLKKPSAAYAWMLAGSAVILADLLRQYVIGSWLPSVAGYTAFPSPYTPQVVTDFSASSDYGNGLGAFPSPYEGVGAYPSDQYGF